MNSKQFKLLIGAGFVLGGIGLTIYSRNAASWSDSSQTMGKSLLGEFPINEVSHIVLRQGTNAVNLAVTNDLWTVRERGGYAANFNDISDFVRKARELKVVQTLQVGPSKRARLELEEPDKAGGGTLVEFHGAGGKVLKNFLLGKKHMKQTDADSAQMQMGGAAGLPDGRYVLVPERAEQVAIVSDPLANIEVKPELWLDKTFFKVEKPKAISLVSTNATNSWKITRESEAGEWKLTDAKPGETLDPGKVSGAANGLQSPTFVDVTATTGAAQSGLEHPVTITFDTFDGLLYSLKVGNKTAEDNYFVTVSVAANAPSERTPGKEEKPEEKERLDKEFKDQQKRLEEKVKFEKSLEKWTFLVPKWTIDPVLRERAQLLPDPKEKEGTPGGAPGGLPPGFPGGSGGPLQIPNLVPPGSGQ